MTRDTLDGAAGRYRLWAVVRPIDPMTRFKVGDRVGFARQFLTNIGTEPADPKWRTFGVVVGFQPPRYVRVKFDGEDAPRAVAAVNLAKPGTTS